MPPEEAADCGAAALMTQHSPDEAAAQMTQHSFVRCTESADQPRGPACAAQLGSSSPALSLQGYVSAYSLRVPLYAHIESAQQCETSIPLQFIRAHPVTATNSPLSGPGSGAAGAR
jgi:hypothetical protein